MAVDPANSAVEVTPTEFVDARLREPRPSRLWKWWVQSTLRAVILKLLGLDSEEAYKAAVDRNATLVLKRLQFQQAQINGLQSRVANLESHKQSKNGKILTLDAS